MMRILITAAAAAGLSAVIGWFLIPVLRALKAGQSIREVGPTWHNSKSGTPMMGGLMFIAAAVLCMAVCAFWMADRTPLLVLLLAVCFGAIGFLDDFAKIRHKKNLGLKAWQKLLLQVAVTGIFLLVLIRSGKLESSLYIPFWNTSVSMNPVLYCAVMMFIMVGCVNAVNLTDGVDGLCGSVTIPVMVFFTAAAAAMGRYDMALLPAALTGGLIAYLFYNWHPAKVFMGDTGSLFLGGAVCALAIAMDMPLILVLVGLVYMCETLSVILQVGYFKLTHGKRLFRMSPIHHHFEMCGWKEEKIVFVFTGICAVMCLLAWVGISGRL